MKTRKDHKTLDLMILKNNLTDITSPTPMLIGRDDLSNFNSPKAKFNRNEVLYSLTEKRKE